MALVRACDNPACETVVRLLIPAEVENLPAGWWLLQRSSTIGEQPAEYGLCSLRCVAVVAELYDDDDPRPALELEDDAA